MGKLVMGYWDCPVCGSKEIRGDVVNCPSCGRARGDVKFYMKGYTEGEIREENERGDVEYLTEEQEKYVSKNPDWYCSFCNSLNSDNAQVCGNCGASRADSEGNYFDQLKKRREREAAEAAAQPQPSAPRNNSGKRLLLILAVIVLALVGWTVYRNGYESRDMSVTAVSWVRSIQIEEYRSFDESGTSVPQGAEVTSQRQEIRWEREIDHYESVPVERERRVVVDHETYYTYEDRGNGTLEEIAHERPVYGTETYTEYVNQPVFRQVPRYYTVYDYTVWRWEASRTATASESSHDPYWPDVTLGENEREGGRTEIYRITVTGADGAKAQYQLEKSAWDSLSTGDTIHLRVKRNGGDPHITDAQNNRLADLRQDQAP